MYDFKWLQMFADGAAGDGGGAAGAAQSGGDNAADAAQQSGETVADRLRRKGVPESKLSRRAYQQKVAQPQRTAPVPVTDNGQAAAAEASVDGQAPAAEAEQATVPEKEPEFDELLKQNPKYNKAVQEIVQKRVAKSKAAEQRLEALTPSIEKIARRYGLGADFTPEQLAERIDNDDGYYEQQAMEMGVTPEVAKKLDEANMILEQREKDRAAREQAEEQDQRIRSTFDRLQSEVAEMQKKYPGFDFRTEMQNPQFVFMLQPGSGLSLEQAYVAIHRNEIIEAERKAAEQRIAATVQANRGRPPETTKKQTAATTATTVDWSRASREQREALKRRIHSGERILPGQSF